MTAHEGRYAGPECPVCGPVVAAAKAAQAEWERVQTFGSFGGRNAPAYKAAFKARNAASRILVAAKQEHYRPALARREEEN